VQVQRRHRARLWWTAWTQKRALKLMKGLAAV